MKPYGLKVIEAPDVGDIQEGARKSSIGRFREKGGDYKSYPRSSVAKRAIRRLAKRAARRQGNAEIIEALED